jgi:hypothetical protein
VWRKEARLIIATLLVVFTVAKAYTYSQGKDIDCGCGGGIAFLKYIYNSPQGIVTNLVLLTLLGVDFCAARRSSRRSTRTSVREFEDSRERAVQRRES